MKTKKLKKTLKTIIADVDALVDVAVVQQAMIATSQPAAGTEERINRIERIIAGAASPRPTRAPQQQPMISVMIMTREEVMSVLGVKPEQPAVSKQTSEQPAPNS